MAKLVGYDLTWVGSPSQDLAGYKVYWNNDGSQPDYLSNVYDVGNVTTVNINAIDGFPNTEGNMTIGLTAYDGVGNESDMVYNTTFFDYAAPDAPTGFTVVIS